MFCTNCGCKLDDNARFCHQCGTFVGDFNTPSAPGTSNSSGDSGFFVANDLDNQVNSRQGAGSSGSGYEYSDFDDEKTIRVRRPENAEVSSYENSYNNYNNTPSGNAYNENSGRTGTEQYKQTSANSYSCSSSSSYENAYSNSDNGSYGNTYSSSNSSSYENAYSNGNSYSTSGNGSYGNASDDWKQQLSSQNLVRFAPLAAFLPLVSAILRVIFRIIVGIVFPFNYYMRFRVANAISLVLFIVAAAATVYLIYAIITSRNAARISSWITPVGTLFATISCLAIWRYWRIIPVVFGIIAVLMGLEFLARIVIAGEDIASPFNPGAAAETYSWYFKNYKDQYPTSKQMERAGYVDPEKSYFDGSGIELLGYTVLSVIVCCVTCGLAFPWMYCKIARWRLEHTVINENRLTFTGSGGSLFGHWILWEILTVVTCGIYGFFVYCALRRWELEHTYIQGEPVYANDKVSRFDGATIPFIGYSILAALGTLFTCGIAFPWMLTMIQRWDTEHQVINNRRLKYSGTGIGFFGEFLIIGILSLITCGIYSSWGIVRMNKYIIRNTDFVDYMAQ